MTARVLTTDCESSPRFVEDPIKELMAAMIAGCKDAFEALASNASPLLVCKGKKAAQHRNIYVKPVVQSIAWISDQDTTGSPYITFERCCEYLNLDSELVKDLLIGLLKKVPKDGLAGINWYINRLVSDSCFKREHYLPVGGKD